MKLVRWPRELTLPPVTCPTCRGVRLWPPDREVRNLLGQVEALSEWVASQGGDPWLVARRQA